MPGSDPVAQTLDVPGARLYYERQGAGPLLLMIGSPMDSTGFAGLARALADRYTVVTYDPRGIGHSTREDATQDDTYRADGPDQAMAEFMAHAGLGEPPGQQAGAPRWEPSPEQVATMRAATDMFLAHLLRPTTDYRPGVEALRAAPARIVVAVGATSKGQLAHRSAVVLADRLGRPVVEFPGDHAGFMALPEQCAQVLDQVLTQPT